LELHRLDSPFEQREQRPLVALVSGVLSRCEADVRRRPRKPLANGRIECSEELDPTDLLRSHHKLTRLPPERKEIR
jgi:hypothetical protein